MALRSLAFLVAALAGAGLMLYRGALWRYGDPVYRGFHVPAEVDPGTTVRWARAYAKVEIPDLSGWRPLHVTLVLHPAPDAPATGTPLTVSIDDVPVRRFRVTAATSRYDLLIDQRRSKHSPLVWPVHRLVGLQLQSEILTTSERGVGVGDVEVRSVITPRAALPAAVRGAGLGVLVCLLVIWPRRASPRDHHVSLGGESTRRRSAVAGVACTVLVFAYFVAWASVKPPMQSPDESNHYIKALAMPGTPWAARHHFLPVWERRWNPFCGWRLELKRLASDRSAPSASLREEDLPALRAVRWPESTATVDRLTTAWSYPPLFYWTAFALGQPSTVTFGLTPYQSVFAWRVGVCFVAALLWVWVWAILARVEGCARHRWWLTAFVLANPMLAFISSSVNPDALLVPLATLTVLYSLLQLRHGGYSGITFAVMLATSLVKPSGPFVIAALGPAVLLVWLAKQARSRNVIEWVRAAGLATLVAWAAFYAWSPPKLYGEARGGVSLAQYLDFVVSDAQHRWTSYWGKPGWLDYQADPWFYTCLLWLLAAVAVLAVLRAERWRAYGSFVPFTLVYGLGFLAATLAGEFMQVPEIGYTFQGRYVLPASIGVAALVLAGGRLPRMAMLGMVLWLNVNLFEVSVHRYYGNWSRYVRAQPVFGATPLAATPEAVGQPGGTPRR